MESIKYGNLLINFTSQFQWLWDSNGSTNASPGAFWRPVPNPEFLKGYFPLGDVVIGQYGNHQISGKKVVAVVGEGDPNSEGARVKGKALSPPDEYELVWNDIGSKAYEDGAVWRPVAPEGYLALGFVTTRGYQKPSRNAIRCVRADLVIASYISDLIWNDRGSNAAMSFSAWNITPPGAAQGEIYLSPGTFVGADSYARPDQHIAAYSLRMRIPLQVNPSPPAPHLTDHSIPSPHEKAEVTHMSTLPWFTVKDPHLSPVEQLRSSPTYRLERTDKYLRVGFGRNESSATQTLKWVATNGQNGSQLETFTRTTAIEIGSEWQFSITPLASSIKFSAKFNKSLTHTETSTQGWTSSTSIEISATVPAHKTIAVYLIQSEYRLLRENNTQISSSISYTDGNSVYWSEYPPARECQINCRPLSALESKAREAVITSSV
ncbi:hypothetical protein PspCFBP13528_07800 [Pseudomonas sp. CFBP13528]|uniref:Vps62-related protein n=1 Tax=Pseudomonas sp. CFBP13528 TaxID=2184006 RepID=UPI0010C10B06|nr:Vps62-related protein [Pseudomonas sp. CFBP13528]TKK33594.1 hypothetical protein PspCFBP13528_07800 [Pseudomonas sp. CFBP13528]